LGVPEL